MSRKDSSCCRSIPRNLRTAVERLKRPCEAARSQAEQLRALDRRGAEPSSRPPRTTTVGSGAVEGRPDDARSAGTAENELRMRQTDLRSQEQNRQDPAAPHAAGAGVARKRERYDLSKVRIESPINGIVTRRNIEEGETVVIGTMNNPGRFC